MAEVLTHIMSPRVFYTKKRGLVSDSELVRKYAGVFVAGEKENTNIAFGYAAESYVDFGVPLMFLPVFIYGLMMGITYQGFLRIIRHRDLAIGRHGHLLAVPVSVRAVVGEDGRSGRHPDHLRRCVYVLLRSALAPEVQEPASAGAVGAAHRRRVRPYRGSALNAPRARASRHTLFRPGVPMAGRRRAFWGSARRSAGPASTWKCSRRPPMATRRCRRLRKA